jgi:hypothetical protein
MHESTVKARLEAQEARLLKGIRRPKPVKVKPVGGFLRAAEAECRAARQTRR